MKRYDLHCHTHYSPCSSIRPIDLLKMAKKKGLDGMAVTDHNTLKGSDIVKKLNKDRDFEVISGSEIRTDCGDMIAIYIEEKVNSRLVLEVLDEIRSQDGIAIVPHPFRFGPWLKFRYPLEKIKDQIDAIETMNARNFSFSNKLAQKEAEKLEIAQVGSSDCHIMLDIGRGYTIFEEDLRKAIRKKQTRAYARTGIGLLSGSIAAFNKRIRTPLGLKKRWN